MSGGQWGRRDLGRGNGICKVWGHEKCAGEGEERQVAGLRRRSGAGPGSGVGHGHPQHSCRYRETSPHESWRRDPEIAPCVRFLAILHDQTDTNPWVPLTSQALKSIPGFVIKIVIKIIYQVNHSTSCQGVGGWGEGSLPVKLKSENNQEADLATSWHISG